MFEVAEASGVRTGTKIIIHLKADSREFASEARVRGEREPGPLGQALSGLRVVSSSHCCVVSLANPPGLSPGFGQPEQVQCQVLPAVRVSLLLLNVPSTFQGSCYP